MANIAHLSGDAGLLGNLRNLARFPNVVRERLFTENVRAAFECREGSQVVILVGIDDNMTDGALLIWPVPSTPFLANVWARAIGPDGTEVSTDPILVVNNG